MTTTELAFWGVTIHLFVDWLLQNEWMALYKSDIKSIAGWLHAGLHVFCLSSIFPFQWALLIGIIHLLVDTRVPLNWWRRVYKQTTTGEMGVHVAIWQDQVVHWLVICVAAILLKGGIG